MVVHEITPIPASQETVVKVSRESKGAQECMGLPVNGTWQNASKAAGRACQHPCRDTLQHLWQVVEFGGSPRCLEKGKYYAHLQKQGKKRDLGNYKWVNLTWVPWKIMEWVLLEAISGHEEEEGNWEKPKHTSANSAFSHCQQFVICFIIGSTETLEAWPSSWRSRRRRHKGKSSGLPLSCVIDWPTPLNSGPTFSLSYLPTHNRGCQYFLVILDIFCRLQLDLDFNLSLCIFACLSDISVFCFGSLFLFPSLSCSFFLHLSSVSISLFNQAGFLLCLLRWMGCSFAWRMLSECLLMVLNTFGFQGRLLGCLLTALWARWTLLLWRSGLYSATHLLHTA